MFLGLVKLSITIILLVISFIRTIMIIRTPELSAVTRGVQIFKSPLYKLWKAINFVFAHKNYIAGARDG